MEGASDCGIGIILYAPFSCKALRFHGGLQGSMDTLKLIFGWHTFDGGISGWKSIISKLSHSKRGYSNWARSRKKENLKQLKDKLVLLCQLQSIVEQLDIGTIRQLDQEIALLNAQEDIK